MAPILLPDLYINASSAENSINELFKAIKPEWNQDDIIIETVSGGMSGTMFLVYLENNPDDAYIVRVRNPAIVDYFKIADPKFELKVIQELSKMSLFPTVSAVFQNGYCYEYIKGKPIFKVTSKPQSTPVLEQSTKKALLKKLAEIHSVEMKNEDYSKNNYFSNLEIMLENYYPDNNPEVLDKSIVKKEFNELMNYMKEFNLKTVLCHGDAHPGNVVWNREEDKMTFVDWEASHIGYQAYDVGYILQMFHMGDVVPMPGLPKSSETMEEIDEMKKEIAKCYFEKWCELNSLVFDEESLQEFLRQVIFFQLVWCFTMIILFGVITNIQESFNKEFRTSPSSMMNHIYKYYCDVKERKLRESKLK